MKKRKHHHVWKFYLKAWATAGKIYYLRENGIKNPNIIGVANKRDFYKTTQLTTDDMQFIKTLFNEIATPQYKILRDEWITFFADFLELEELLRSFNSQNTTVYLKINEMIHNFHEDYHSKIEGEMIPIFQQLYNEKMTFIDNENLFEKFLHFLCVQYFRTRAIRDGVTNTSEAYNFPQIGKTWHIFSMIFASNMTLSLYTQRSQLKFIFLKSNTLNFITGDQPIINTFADYKCNRILGADEFEFYYPIAPDKALLITTSPKYQNKDHINISEFCVNNYNTKIFLASYKQIYAKEKTDLLEFQKL